MIELKAYSVVASSEAHNYINGEINLAFEAYDADEVDTYIASLRGANEEKTERIVELQKQVDELDGVKKSAELILMNLLDCGLIKEWYFNGKFNAILKADDPHLKIAELKQKLENVQASMYADVVDANMENRRLKRALWLARADRAKARKNYWYARSCHEGDDFLVSIDGSPVKYIGCIKRTNYDWLLTWSEVERKCRAKAEEYK